MISMITTSIALVTSLRCLSLALLNAAGLVLLQVLRAGPTVSMQHSPLFPVLLILSMSERLCAFAADVAVERDWITQLAGAIRGNRQQQPVCLVQRNHERRLSFRLHVMMKDMGEEVLRKSLGSVCITPGADPVPLALIPDEVCMQARIIRARWLPATPSCGAWTCCQSCWGR